MVLTNNKPSYSEIQIAHGRTDFIDTADSMFPGENTKIP